MSGFDEKIQLLTERPHQRKGVNYTTLKMNSSNTLLSTAPEETAASWVVHHQHFFYFILSHSYFVVSRIFLCVCVCNSHLFLPPLLAK